MSAKKQYFFCHKLRLIGFQVFAPGAKCRLDAFGQSVPGPVLVSTNIFFHCPAFGLSGIQMKDSEIIDCCSPQTLVGYIQKSLRNFHEPTDL